MSLKSVFQQISKLSSTSSENAKVVLLQEYMQDPLFSKVAMYALDSRKTYNVKQFPKYSKYSSSTQNETLFAYLDELNSTPGTSKAQKNALYAMASSDAETYEVVKRICNADLKCGCGVKLFNKAVKDSIFYIPYCRCSTDKKITNIEYPAIAQEKADGMFVNVIIDYKGKVTFRTREGKKVKQLKRLRKLIEINVPVQYHGIVLHGELLSYQNGKVLSRKIGNGIFSSCLYGLADQRLADTAILRVWDAVPIEDFWKEVCNSPYEERFNLLLDIVHSLDAFDLQPVQYEVVNSLDEAGVFYRKMRALGKEGAILKNLKMIWKYHTSTNQIKMKNVMDVELIMTGWYYGKEDSKYAKCLGGINCKSACGEIKVNVGSGFSDAQRGFFPVPEDHPNAVLSNDNSKGYIDEETGEFFPPVYIDEQKRVEALNKLDNMCDSIVGLECESIIQSKTKETHSLYLPRFVEVRTDKKADTLKELIAR